MLSTTRRLQAMRDYAASALLLLIATAGPVASQPAPHQGALAAGALSPTARQTENRNFPTPEEAVLALITALRAPVIEPLVAILGRPVLDSVPRDERQAAELRRAAGNWLAGQPFEIAYQDEAHTRAIALFGEARVQLPAVLARASRGWIFDQKSTIASMRERRIGVNEANAIRALRVLGRAQERFRITDRTGDGILRYARHIRSSPGQLDGLVASQFIPGPSTDLLNEAFARAEGDPGDHGLTPAGGYAYRMLTGQGAHAEGGMRSYLVDGRLTEGYAVVAWPIRPGETGLSTFTMNQRGAVFEREFGARTVEEVRQITAFDPGPGWIRVEEGEQ